MCFTIFLLAVRMARSRTDSDIGLFDFVEVADAIDDFVANQGSSFLFTSQLQHFRQKGVSSPQYFPQILQWFIIQSIA